MTKEISIITVVLNDITGLKNTYLSIKSSLCAEIEWVVIDGNSKDGSVNFLKELDDPNLTFISEPDNGMYDAMNKGIEVASGKYFQFLNAGDILECNLQESFMAKKYEEDLIFFNIRKVDENSKEIPWKLPLDFIEKQRKYPSVPHQSTFVHKNIIDKIGKYDDSFKILGDYDFFLKIFNTKDFQPTYVYVFDLTLVSFICNGITFQYRSSLKVLKEFITIQRKYYNRIYLKTVIMFIAKYLISFIPGHIKHTTNLRRYVKFQ